MLQAPYPEIDDLLEMMGEAGQRLSDIEASEGAAGNISVCLRWPIEPRTRFPLSGGFRSSSSRSGTGGGNVSRFGLGTPSAGNYR